MGIQLVSLSPSLSSSLWSRGRSPFNTLGNMGAFLLCMAEAQPLVLPQRLYRRGTGYVTQTAKQGCTLLQRLACAWT
jgi:hypothetical protein